MDFGLGPKTNKHEVGLEEHLLCALQLWGGRRWAEDREIFLKGITAVFPLLCAAGGAV